MHRVALCFTYFLPVSLSCTYSLLLAAESAHLFAAASCGPQEIPQEALCTFMGMTKGVPVMTKMAVGPAHEHSCPCLQAETG